MHGSAEAAADEEEYDQLSSDETLSEDYGAEKEESVIAEKGGRGGGRGQGLRVMRTRNLNIGQGKRGLEEADD